jgi:hypothetical protein
VQAASLDTAAAATDAWPQRKAALGELLSEPDRVGDVREGLVDDRRRAEAARDAREEEIALRHLRRRELRPEEDV